MNEWQLVAAYAAGDEQAFADLLHRFFPLVYSAAVRQVGDTHLAEDIAQSVFILFARKANSLSRSVALTGWLLRTTRFVAKDALKQLHRRQRKEQALAELEGLHRAWPPDGNRAAPLVDEALLKLAASEQICVIARFFDGLSFKEIAEAQQISGDAAQKRVTRGLEKMRAYLSRRRVPVTAGMLTGMLSVNFAQAGEIQLIQAALANVHAALHGQATVESVWLADHIARVLARQTILKLAAGLTSLALLFLGGFAFRTSLWPSSASARFQVSDNRLDVLGRAWALVTQRAAFIVQFPPNGPPPNDPNRLAYVQATQFVLAETTRVSTELNTALQAGRERAQLAEFLTVELRETLGLNGRQQAEVFAQLQTRLKQGTTYHDGLQTLWQAKPELTTALRKMLSAEQQQRFNQTYGPTAVGLLAFVVLVLQSNG